MANSTALPYENRMGDVYYLQEGKTRTGKPKYYTGRKLTGTPLAVMPEGHEFYERPDTGQVVIRKIPPSPITEFERRQAEDIVRRVSGLKHFVVHIEENALVVYTPSTTAAEADKMIGELAGPFSFAATRADAYRDRWIRRSQYMKMLRFRLIDPNTRQYGAERWCFRGSIDRWITLLHGSGALADLVAEYARHLDRESFYELM